MKAIDNLTLQDAKKIYDWHMKFKHGEVSDHVKKIMVRDYLKFHKQTPDQCLEGISKEMSSMPSFKSF